MDSFWILISSLPITPLTLIKLFRRVLPMAFILPAFFVSLSSLILLHNLKFGKLSGLTLPKVEFFCWLVINENAPAKVELIKRNILHASSNICPFYGKAPESSVYLFFHCLISWKVWMACCNYQDLNLVISRDTGSFFSSWQSMTTFKSSDGILRMLFFSVIWSIWLH